MAARTASVDKNVKITSQSLCSYAVNPCVSSCIAVETFQPK